MAQAERRRAQQEMPANSAAAAETAKKVVSAIATGGDAWMEGHAELLEQVDQMSQRWIQSQREAIEVARQSIAEMQRARPRRHHARATGMAGGHMAASRR